jgi:hypothetical protein
MVPVAVCDDGLSLDFSPLPVRQEPDRNSTTRMVSRDSLLE